MAAPKNKKIPIAVNPDVLDAAGDALLRIC